MNFVQRRRFLWILFLVRLAALALSAVLTTATTLARLQFNELAQTSTAIARLRCIGSQVLWEQGELWTETRFEVIERNKGLLRALSPCAHWAEVAGICIPASRERRCFGRAKTFICFCGRSPWNPIACWAGRREPSGLPETCRASHTGLRQNGDF